MGQKKRDRTRAWLNEQLAIEWRRRTEEVIAEIKAKNEKKESEKDIGEEKNESEEA